ncbi:MAG: hypothetical protein Ta2B_07930 [Termitinemataceae bacterium]|nr:MAG: hypothetical protein Ta2B_07930 [Termitinemataceae bacterium]
MICDLLDKLPPISSNEREGFFFADCAYCYPDDRSNFASIRVGKELAKNCTLYMGAE